MATISGDELSFASLRTNCVRRGRAMDHSLMSLQSYAPQRL